MNNIPHTSATTLSQMLSIGMVTTDNTPVVTMPNQTSHAPVIGPHPVTRMETHGPTVALQNAGQLNALEHAGFSQPDRTSALHDIASVPILTGGRSFDVRVPPHMTVIGGTATSPFGAVAQANILRTITVATRNNDPSVTTDTAWQWPRLSYNAQGATLHLFVDEHQVLREAELIIPSASRTVSRQVRFDFDLTYPNEPTLSLYDQHWLETHLPPDAVTHVVRERLGTYDPRNPAHRSDNGNPIITFHGQFGNPPGTWHGMIEFTWNNGRFMPQRMAVQAPGETRPGTVFHPAAIRSRAPVTATSSGSRSGTSSLQAPSARSVADGFMTQDAYRRRLPPQYSRAQVCAPVSMSDALGIVLPFDLLGSPVAGMTMPEVRQAFFSLGIGQARMWTLAPGRRDQTGANGRPQIENELHAFLSAATIDGAVIEYHWTDNSVQPPQAASHFISMSLRDAGNNAYVRVADSRTGRLWNFPRGQERHLAAHLAALYREGPPGQERVSIIVPNRSQLRNPERLRAQSVSFLNPPRTVNATGAAGRTTAAMHPRMARLFNLDGLAQARNAAHAAAVAAAGAWPQDVSDEALANVRFERITRDQFTEVEEAAWSANHPWETAETAPRTFIRVICDLEDGAATLSLVTDSPPLHDAVAQLEAAQAALDDDTRVAGFFSRVATQPLPTLGVIPDGAQFFRTNPDNWAGAMPPDTDPIDASHARMLSDLIGTPVSPRELVRAAPDRTQTLVDRLLITAGDMGRTASIDSLNADLDPAGMTNYVNSLAENIVLIESSYYDSDGNLQTGLVPLRRDAEGEWWLNHPAGGWQTPTGGLAGILQGVMQQHVPEIAVRVLRIGDADELEFTDTALRNDLSLAHEEFLSAATESPENTQDISNFIGVFPASLTLRPASLPLQPAPNRLSDFSRGAHEEFQTISENSQTISTFKNTLVKLENIYLREEERRNGVRPESVNFRNMTLNDFDQLCIRFLNYRYPDRPIPARNNLTHASGHSNKIGLNQRRNLSYLRLYFQYGSMHNGVPQSEQMSMWAAGNAGYFAHR